MPSQIETSFSRDSTKSKIRLTFHDLPLDQSLGPSREKEQNRGRKGNGGEEEPGKKKEYAWKSGKGRNFEDHGTYPDAEESKWRGKQRGVRWERERGKSEERARWNRVRKVILYACVGLGAFAFGVLLEAS